ncbi:NAD(P)H-hydrate dehydratase [Streptomyces sp. M19]
MGRGPGLGDDAGARQALEQVLDSEVPVLVDADGLRLLPGRWRAPRRPSSPRTPGRPRRCSARPARRSRRTG